MIRLKLDILEDRLPAALVSDPDLGRADAPEDLLVYWRAALARLETHPRLVAPILNPDFVRGGLVQNEATIERSCRMPARSNTTSSIARTDTAFAR